MKFHPDKYSPNLGISPEQGMAMFQMYYNNAYEFLKDPANRPKLDPKPREKTCSIASSS